jgi:hypothetical protein
MRLEYRMIGPGPDAAPTLVMLHEGLGHAGIWGSFADELAAATGDLQLVLTPHLAGEPIGPKALAQLLDEARRLAEAFAVNDGLAFVDVAALRKGAKGPAYDKTELLLLGQERAPWICRRNVVQNAACRFWPDSRQKLHGAKPADAIPRVLRPAHDRKHILDV